MLRTLYIRDYALIEELEVEFDSGLNIITGETGAGKSIIIGALKMILGERASTELIRSGARKAIIEGIFDDVENTTLQQILHDHAIDPSATLILRREITRSQSRAFINDTPATVNLLRTIAAHMIDLHGQHEHQSLLRTETHLALLDDFGGLGGLIEKYHTHYTRMAELRHEHQALIARERELKQEKELIAFQIEEIDRVAPQAEEEQQLEAEQRVLENAERLYSATERLHHLLYESEGSIYDQLVIARNELQDLARIDAQFQDGFGEIKSAEVIVAEVTQFMQDYNARIEFNPERLEDIRARLGELTHLKRKYGGTLEAVLTHRITIGQTFDLASDFEGAIARMEQQIAAQRAVLSESAQRLSVKRKEVAERIEQAIVHELKQLGIPHGQFVVQFTHEEDPNGWIALPTYRDHEAHFTAFANGMDVVEFYISTNVGEAPKPLARVASGGEISRIMLALKTILAKSERLPILVFDEIDTGISGAMGRKVGESMHNLAHYHQIIAITHLAQIAALGDVHFVAEKRVEAGRTKTGLRRLSGDESVAQIASLIAGTEITEAALRSARELMQNQ